MLSIKFLFCECWLHFPLKSCQRLNSHFLVWLGWRFSSVYWMPPNPDVQNSLVWSLSSLLSLLPHSFWSKPLSPYLTIWPFSKGRGSRCLKGTIVDQMVARRTFFGEQLLWWGWRISPMLKSSPPTLGWVENYLASSIKTTGSWSPWFSMVLCPQRRHTRFKKDATFLVSGFVFCPKVICDQTGV